uniref:N-acetyltransferase domain-containing protein n=1 Tax=Panagrolaimus sp. ES5 TaxID=591445 RepID=A0AC34FRN2_9BILA
MMEFKITKLTPDDMKHVKMMVQELAEFEKMPNGPKLSIENFQADLKSNHFFGFIAMSENNEPAGMALCYMAYSTWEGPFIHMEDLYVRPSFRKSGLGKKLVVAVCKEAKDKNYQRVQWNVLDWNPAREFYNKLGATNLSEKEGWLAYRLEPEQISKIASQEI